MRALANNLCSNLQYPILVIFYKSQRDGNLIASEFRNWCIESLDGTGT